MPRIKKTTLSRATKDQLIASRIERAEYEDNHALESTIVMAFDTARNTMATVNNVAVICRNKSEIKVIESIGELEEAYAKLLA